MPTTYVACSDLKTRTLQWAPRNLDNTPYSLACPITEITLTSVQIAKVCRNVAERCSSVTIG